MQLQALSMVSKASLAPRGGRRRGVLARGALRSVNGTRPLVESEAGRRALKHTWPGFVDWRRAEPRRDVVWGAGKKSTTEPTPGSTSSSSTSSSCFTENHDEDEDDKLDSLTLAECGKLVLETSDPKEKALLTHQAYLRFAASREGEVGVARGPEEPGRPALPKLVPPRDCPGPKQSGLSLSAYMIHNLAHIELNAVDLAWDTVVSFSSNGDLPREFFVDFLRVADDESRHLRWCLQRLKELGAEYGDLPSHGLLWSAGAATRHDLLARLVAIPMVQEARGLDAGPRLVQRLRGSGDARSAAIVEKIAEEERAHVAVGVFWFRYLCDGMTCEEVAREFHRIADEHCGEMIRGPFETETREAVGLLEQWFAPVSAR